MTRDDAFALAREAGFRLYDLHDVDGQDLGESVKADEFDALVRFADLVIEMCAKKIEDMDCAFGCGVGGDLAKVIRARKDSS